ncbi:MAG: hypothetical protein R3B09_24530 [Nannocystaceae bacterium]
MSTPPATFSPAVDAVVQRLSRAAGDGALADRRAFTVARTEAVLRLREIPRGDPWQWTVSLLQAAMAACRFARAEVDAREEEAERVTTLRFAVPGADLAAVDLGELLLGALDEAPGGLGDPTPEEGARRCRVALAVAVNAGLAQGPAAIEVVTPTQHAIFSRRESVKEGQDPYRQARGGDRSPEHSVVVRVREPRPSFGRRLATFLALRGDAIDGIARVWERALLPAPQGLDLRAGVDLHRQLPGARVRLGDHALWGRIPEEVGVWLVRDAVKVLDLGKALAAAGVDVAAFRGWIECPALRLTADGARVSEGPALDLLVAWLLDAQAHSFQAAGLPQVIWPAALDHVPTASGRPVPLALIQQAVREGRDFPYEWPHRQDHVPEAMRARTYVLWPSELALLGQRVPGLRAVPARSLGEIVRVARADLSALEGASLPALPLDLGGAAELALPGGQALRLAITALVHRSPTADEGSILLLAYGRRLAQSRDEKKALPGVTLVCELADDVHVAVDELRGDREGLAAALARAQAAALGAREAILAHAFTHDEPWELPFVRSLAAQATPQSVGLAYQSQGGELRLGWSEGPLLALEVGKTRGGERVTLGDALQRLRDRGGILVDDPKQRWGSLEPADAARAMVRLTPHGRALCLRVLGHSALWEMPTAPEAHVQVRAASAQRGLVLGHGAVDQHRRSLGRVTRAREALRAHLLIASALGDPTYGLEQVPLFTRYDPRAMTPSRFVSLTEIVDEAPRPRLQPAGAVGRELTDVVIEATPGEAALLHQVLGLGAASPRAEPRLEPSGAIRRHSHERAPLVTLPVADELATGTLRIDDPEAGRSAISLWSSGLHIDDLTLPEPLDCVGGRLWLSAEGMKAGTERLAAHLRALARELIRRALQGRLLHAPETAEARALAVLIERLRAPRGDASWVADLLPEGAPGLRRAERLARSLKLLPLRRLLGGGVERLTLILRQSLAAQVVVDTAMLSWKVATVNEAPAPRGGRWVLELGRRNGWIQRGLAAEAGPAPFDAAALVVAVALAQARARALGAGDPDEEAVAMYRLLALAYAHG